MSCGHIECPAGWCRLRADRFRSAPTEAPPPRTVIADDLREKASRLFAMGKKLINESSDLRAAADRIERGEE